VAVLTDIGAADPRGSAAPQNDPVTTSLYGDALREMGANGAGRHNTTGDMIKSRMPELVKGAGLAPKGGNMPLTNHTEIMTKAAQASFDIRAETWKGFGSKSSVVNSLNQGWLDGLGALKTGLLQVSPLEQMAAVLKNMPGGEEALNKSFTAGNLGIGSIEIN
jgi:hypothetical protein